MALAQQPCNPATAPLVLSMFNERGECSLSFIRPFSCSTSTAPTYNCHTCSFSTPFFVSLHRHVKEGHRALEFDSFCKPLKCHLCDFGSHSFLVLLRHYTRCHDLLLEPGPLTKGTRFRCNVCLFETLEQDVLWWHISVEHTIVNRPAKAYPCDRCSFVRADSNRRTIPQPPPSVPVEKATSETSPHVGAYSCSASTTPTYNCHTCSFSTPFFVTLRRHVKEGHRVLELDSFRKPLKCHLCDFRSHSFLVLLPHYMRCHDLLLEPEPPTKGTWFRCDVCQFETLQQDVLGLHISAKHATVNGPAKAYPSDQSYDSNRQTISQPPPNVPVEKAPSDTSPHVDAYSCSAADVATYICPICGFSTAFLLSLKTHVQQVHRKSDFGDACFEKLECLLCCFRTHSLLVLLRHARERHHRQLADETFRNGRWFECELCPYQSLQRYALWVHVYAKHDGCASVETVYRCNQCAFVCKKAVDFYQHKAVRHHVEGLLHKWPCSYCPFQAWTSPELNAHVKEAHKQLRLPFFQSETNKTY